MYFFQPGTSSRRECESLQLQSLNVDSRQQHPAFIYLTAVIGVQVVRENGTKVSLVSSLHYDAMAQPNNPFISPIDLLPGDRIVTTCVYDTSGDKDAVVWGTRKQQDEMCYSSFYFYPAETSISCTNLQGWCNMLTRQSSVQLPIIIML